MRYLQADQACREDRCRTRAWPRWQTGRGRLGLRREFVSRKENPTNEREPRVRSSPLCHHAVQPGPALCRTGRRELLPLTITSTTTTAPHAAATAATAQQTCTQHPRPSTAKKTKICGPVKSLAWGQGQKCGNTLAAMDRAESRSLPQLVPRLFELPF